MALAATVAVFYALRTLAWLAAPGPFLSFMKSLFHGMDFSVLLRPSSFAVGGFVEALLVMSLWAFLRAPSLDGCARVSARRRFQRVLFRDSACR
ncbi:DUF5676 family membrane protein [Variovorax sp. EBFNA2]|uniref:DUF5676 family membrane protein n=1 Tax=Variovorax sp. EBFNA2 TaxID=3342097 RepID=UPI0029C04846|nr:DUF5676 family membrane protein [Variovorax boronicumulans]WPG41375.1 DUF5676 family membrane protein [Variovorax boronicumulans]